MGFNKSKADPNIYMNIMDDELVILLMYVDDLFLTGNEKYITERQSNIAKEFKMKYLGLMHYFLMLEVWKSSEGIFPNQGKYAVEILKNILYVGL